MANIREATPRDAVAVAQLHAKSWRRTYRGILQDEYLDHRLEAERLADWQSRLGAPPPGQYVVVLELEAELQATGSTLAGFACAYGAHDPQAGTLLENLHAHPELKQKGVGRQLLQHIAAWSLRHHPHAALHLWVVASNLAAIDFYRHMGASEDTQALWHAPDGTSIPEQRYTWREPACLLSRVSNSAQ